MKNVALMTRPMLMRELPMSKPMSWKSGLPKMAAMIGKITPFKQRVDDLLEVQRDDQADGDGDEVALVEEVLELLQDVFFFACGGCAAMYHSLVMCGLAGPLEHLRRRRRYGAVMRIGLSPPIPGTGTIDDVVASARRAADDGFST